MKNLFFAVRVVLSLLSFLTFLPGTSRAQILSYTNDTSGALNVIATNATGSALSRLNSATKPGTPCNTGFSVTSFSTGSIYSAVLPCIETSVSANTGYALQVTGFSIDMRRSAAGPASVRFAYSIDGGSTWADQGLDQSPNNAGCGITTTATWATSLTVTAPAQLKFRVYGFNAGSISGNFQALNLQINGSVTGASSSCGVPTGLIASAITSTSATLSWAPVAGASGYAIQYRPIGTATWSTTSSGSTSVAITGLLPATSYEFEVEAMCGSGASGFSGSGAFTTTLGTTSGSSGKMAIYFNMPVDNTVSAGVDAVYLPSHMADTLVAYINRAKYSIDIAQYDYNQSGSYANIATAINAAYAAGKKVRWIYDGSQSNTGLALLNSGIHTLGSPTTTSYGIMHNKFVIIDASSSNPNDAILCTGSEDWGVTQFNLAPNNILFIQDSALAHAYTNEFNMMWGDTGIAPNSSLSKFGPDKTDLGAHLFNIGGKTVELYFSPSDHTDTHIQSTINSANTDLYFGVYAFTVAADANAIAARQSAGVYVTGIVDQYSNTSAAYPILTGALGTNMKTYAGSGAVVYHNKMLIVDPSDNCSDPMVLTGSHNWTNSANTKNDENTLIIHDDTIANIYYQSYKANFTSLGGTMTTIPNCTIATCGNTTALTPTSVTSSSALLNWVSVPGAVSYNVQYRATGSATWSSTSSSTTSVTVTGLTPATTYEYEVETVCASGTSSYSSPIDFTTLALPCSVPAGLSATGVTSNSATISWTAVSGAVSYNIEYRILGAGSWLSATSAVSSFTLSGLASGSGYEFAVEVVCATGTSGYSLPDTFTTATVTCALTAGLAITVMSPGSVVLNWTAVPGAASYSIEYQKVGTPGWLYTTSTTTSKLIVGLTPATTYQFQVQTICSTADSSGYAASAIATTMPFTTLAGELSDAAASLSISPNPTAGDVTASYSLTTATNICIEVYDLVGRLIGQAYTIEQQAEGSHQYKFTLPDQGIYFVKLKAGGVSVTKKVVRF